MRRRLATIAVLLTVLMTGSVFATYCYVFHRTPGAYVETDGVRLYYSEQGTGAPVVLLHGFGVNGDINWRLTGVTRALREHYRVILLDLRGHGLSSKPHDPTAYGAELARDVVRLMDHLELPRAHVAGYSLGGYVALKLAAMHPERLRSVACLGAGWRDPSAPSAESAFANFEAFADQLASGRSVEPVAGAFEEGDDNVTWFHRMQVKMATQFLGDKAGLAALLRGVRGLSLTRDDVVSIDTPMLVVCGERDPNYTSAVQLHEVRPESVFVSVPGKSHPATAASSELLEALTAFLAAH